MKHKQRKIKRIKTNTVKEKINYRIIKKYYLENWKACQKLSILYEHTNIECS